MTDRSLDCIRACRIRQRGALRACTSSGGATSVELELPAGWDESLADADLLREIESASSQAGSG